MIINNLIIIIMIQFYFIPEQGLLMDFKFKYEASGSPSERFLSPNPLKLIQLLCKFHLSALDQSDFIIDAKRFWPRGGGVKPPLPQTLLAALRGIFVTGVVKENLLPILLGVAKTFIN